MTIRSRFIYDLFFLNPEAASITVIVKGTKENEDIKVADKATLVESQSNWNQEEMPRRIDFTDKIQALWPNTKYFRFELKDVGVRDRIQAFHKGESEIAIELTLNLKLKADRNDKELTYFEELKVRCPMKWNS